MPIFPTGIPLEWPLTWCCLGTVMGMGDVTREWKDGN